jgi:hypothetical protein
MIVASLYVFLKLLKYKFGLGICFALGYVFFLIVSFTRIYLFPSHQEWGPLFIFLVSMPASLSVLYLDEVINGPTFFPQWVISFISGYGLLFIVGTIQYYFVGYLVDIILKLYKKAKNKGQKIIIK